MKAEEAKREFAKEIIPLFGSRFDEVREFEIKEVLVKLNALLDEHYYPKKFLMWAIAPENIGKFWSSGYDEVKINGLYNYWKENVK